MAKEVQLSVQRAPASGGALELCSVGAPRGTLLRAARGTLRERLKPAQQGAEGRAVSRPSPQPPSRRGRGLGLRAGQRGLSEGMGPAEGPASSFPAFPSRSHCDHASGQAEEAGGVGRRPSCCPQRSPRRNPRSDYEGFEAAGRRQLRQTSCSQEFKNPQTLTRQVGN